MLTSSVQVGDPLPTISRQFQLRDFVRGGEKTIHTDVAAAQREGLPGPVAIGPQVAALIFRQLRQAFGAAWVNGGRCALTFRKPIPVDEFCTARGTVTKVERGEHGLVVSADVWVQNRTAEHVIVGESRVTL